MAEIIIRGFNRSLWGPKDAAPTPAEGETPKAKDRKSVV